MGALLEPEESYVERLWHNLADLEPHLPAHGPAALVNTRSAFAKAMVLAAGNWLERRTIQALMDFANNASSEQTLVLLLKTSVLDRRFHTLFHWDSGKVNSFLGRFGTDFRQRVQEACRENEDVLRASRDFMRLVVERNELAHSSRISDEAQFTPSEVRAKFYNAAGWVSWIGRFLIECQSARKMSRLSAWKMSR
ncbi:MAG: hypothetical protein OXK77_09745, partial [Gemmatimonadota bacterium]|nr:hypothetical protein [Gemmatimonadota bacterium]MDE2865972.1 hypothetical protein [Gemmatimonadota bacterium]